jgi:hypothetical protein
MSCMELNYDSRYPVQKNFKGKNLQVRSLFVARLKDKLQVLSVKTKFHPVTVVGLDSTDFRAYDPYAVFRV